MTSLLGKAVRAVQPRNLVTGPPDYAGRQGTFFASPGDPPQEAHMAMYAQVGTLFSVVSRLATATSKVEWQLYRKPRAGASSDEDREQIFTHPALNVWSRPNNFYTRNRFVETVQQHCDLTGEQRWIVVRAAGVGRSLGPMELWPVRPDRITPVPSRDTFIAGYIYTAPSGEKVPLEVDDVISVLMPNPLDPYRGLGPVQALMVELDSARYTAEWNRNFFLNSAQPGGVIEVPGDLSDPEFESMTKRWREQHKGVNAAHRVAVLEAGAKWVPNTFTQRDMQFVELRTVSRDAIREAYGIPKFALGDSDDVNRAVGEAMNAFFAEHLTEPRLDRVKEALNFQLLPMFYPGGWRAVDVEFDYVSPVPPDLDKANANRAANVSAAVALTTQMGTDPAATLEAFDLPALPIAAATVEPAPAAPDAPTPADEALAQADVLSRVVSGAGTVVHMDEARALLARAGWPIDPFREPPEQPEPQAPAFGASPDGEDEAPAGANAGSGTADTADGAPGNASDQTPVDARRRPSRTQHGRMVNALIDTPNMYPDRSGLVPVGGTRRPRNSVETRAGLDADGVQSDWLAVLDPLVADYLAVAAVQRADLAGQVQAIVDGTHVVALATLTAPTSELTAVLTDAMTDMSVRASARVVTEAAEQDVTIEPVEFDDHTIALTAAMTSALMGSTLANAASAEAVRWLGYGRTGAQVAAAVDEYLAAYLAPPTPSNALSRVRALLGHALTRVQNMTRVATFEAASVHDRPDGRRSRWFASEILDGNTCAPCRKIDGTELPSASAMVLAYGGGPYLQCLGTIRCRGLAVAVWE